ncbi:glycosyltransferase family 39 protein [Candidatus Daviesbacteria bacterium]|nr:glycosyltransferase family 39 protein [Candidatus Daviesbacteria bacterium]
MKFKIFNLKFLFLFLVLVLAAVLRLWNLGEYPAGFNADEAAIGYNAYSILQTGKDEYGTFYPLAFKSFGDYKPGLYFYFVMPFVATLGLNEIAVRLPSALFGILTVLLAYLLAKKIFEDDRVGLLSALLLTISPWHLQFSRGGWESNAATFFITLGVFLWLKGLAKPIFIFWSLCSFLISMYLYQSPRLIVPLFLLSGVILHKDLLFREIKKLVIFIMIVCILSIPLILQFTSGEGGARFRGLSFFSDKGPLSRIDELRGEHGNLNDKAAKILHNKITAYAPNFLGHYLDHFSTQFLFINGEEVIRNKVPETGEFYLIEAFFLIIGIFYLIRSKFKHTRLLILWILISPIASSMTFQTPNALRSLSMVVPMTIVMGYGLSKIFNILSKNFRDLLLTGCFLLLIFEFIHYLESYYVHYPKRYPLAWEYGFEEMVSKLEKYQDQYEKVVITDRYDQPYILVLFYGKYNPAEYQPQAVLTSRDQFNFGTIRSFDKYEFHKIEPNEIKNTKDTLFIGTDKEMPKNAEIIDQVDFPNGKPAFIFFKT